ncbi:Carbonyl reductase 1, related [Eimeria mitis]|uniref:Carbonyl reductase 1, related n=1 Tax=Eimeria mitis TaxID=44415 RepID=U6JPR8_9EIME|nr:Carbonyl reductase 1, related [Eimeria mitis]CDJ27510.1 Carbonyl reductase 1, related [Eimeria mitis]
MAFLFSAKWAWVALRFILRRREELRNIRKKGFVVVVIGCTSGLGMAIVLAVCDRLSKIQSHGAHTVIITAKTEEEGVLLLERLRHPTVRVGFHQLDASNSNSLTAFSQNLKEKFEHIDILMNCTSMLPSAAELSWHGNTLRIMSADYYEAKLIIQALMPLMALGGRVVIGASSLAELAITWMNEEAFAKLFSPDSTEKDLDEIADGFMQEMQEESTDGKRVYDAMAYPFVQATRIALAHCLGNQLNQSSKDPRKRITVCSFSLGWCRSTSERDRAPFSALDGAEEAVFAAFDASPGEIQGAFLIGRKAAKFGEVFAAINADAARSRRTLAEKNDHHTHLKHLTRKAAEAIEDTPQVVTVEES